jgi:class 3 adenylate cyclase/DNA-binding winged helix-turn-helix (wHTH) protein/tetratricopeptide (TPR) repeat protein
MGQESCEAPSPGLAVRRATMGYVFGPYTLDLAHYELRQDGRVVRLEPRVFDLLAYFVQHAGRTVTTEELLEQLYPQQFAPVDRLTNAVTQARKALGDTGQTQRYIQTVRRRGYRFIAPVTIQSQVETEAPSSPPPAAPLPAEGLGQEDADAGSPPASVPPALPAAPHSVLDPLRTPRITAHDSPDAERRQLTVLVCRVMGAPPHSAALDPEVVLEVVRDYQAMCAEIVDQFAGHMAQEQGDRLVVYFGYPLAHEDDAYRAVRTGLGIVAGMAALNRRRPRDRSVRLAVRVGIHTGVVVVGAMGHDERAQFALGDTPIIAAQMQDLAAPDTVLISLATLRLVEGYFDAQALGTHILEDAAESLAVYQVLQRRTAQSRFEVTATKGLTPLVGREQELQLLRERWAQVQDGWGQGVLLSGEAGIGKSRLVHALKEHLTGEAHTRIECRAVPYYQQSAFYPIVEHIRRLLQLRQDDTPETTLGRLEAVLAPYDFALEEVVPLFAVLLSLPLTERYAPLALTPERQKQKLLEALLTWLLREAERQPVCFIMEDLHWVDPSTLEWLSLLIDQIPTTRVLMLLTFRPDFQPPWAVRSHLTYVTLGRLSPRQTEGMIGQVVGGKPLPVEVMQQVVATTDGVPLFVEELTKMVVELGLVKEREGRYELTGPLPSLAIPATLHDSLMARLDRLGAAKQVAQLGAVVGREFAYEVLQAVAPTAAAVVQQGLAQLVDAELLYQRGLPPQARYRFKHALIQEAAYQSLLRSTRRQYHQRIVRVLEERFLETCESHPELVAHHAFQGEKWEKAVAYFRQAGEKAFAHSANREAVACFEQALVALPHLPESRETCEQAIDLRIGLRDALQPLGEYRRVSDCLREAEALAETLGDQRRLGWILSYKTISLWMMGDYSQGLQTGKRALELAPVLGVPDFQARANLNLGEIYHSLGNYRHALDFLRRNIMPLEGRMRRGSSGTRDLIFSRVWLIYCMAELGEFAEGTACGEESVRAAEALGDPYILTHVYGGIGFLYLCKGDFEKALPMLERGLEICHTANIPAIAATSAFRLGYVYALSGRLAEALSLLEQAAEQFTTTGQARNFSRFIPWLSEAYLLAGRTDEALKLAGQARELSLVHNERGHHAWTLRLLGEILTHRDPLEFEHIGDHYRQALALAEELSMRPLQGHCHLGLGTLYHRMGWLAQARSELCNSIELFRALAMTFWLTRAEAELAQAVRLATIC